MNPGMGVVQFFLKKGQRLHIIIFLQGLENLALSLGCLEFGLASDICLGRSASGGSVSPGLETWGCWVFLDAFARNR